MALKKLKGEPTVTQRSANDVFRQRATMIFRTSLNIGHDGSSSAHVHDLMGCATLASTKERAISRLESTIADYYRWLRSKERGYRPCATQSRRYSNKEAPTAATVRQAD